MAYQSYVAEFQKAKSNNAVVAMNKALAAIFGTPEGLTLLNPDAFHYKKTYTQDYGIFKDTYIIEIRNKKELDTLLSEAKQIWDNESFHYSVSPSRQESMREYYNAYRNAIRNTFLYYHNLKNKLRAGIDREVKRVKRINEDLEKSRTEMHDAFHDGQNTAIPPAIKLTIFAKMHPKVALEIGHYRQGSTNISTNAVRFATQGKEELGGFADREDGNRQVNAFRHTIWQGTLAARYGEKIAKHVGYANEVNPRIDLNIRQFATPDEADQTVDLLNNEIGRRIGLNSNTTSMKALAFATLEIYHKEGLYVALKNSSGYEVVKAKLDDHQYNYMKSVYEKVDENGMK
ncbi:DUF6973 domain-containing protein [Xenorhabdus sp. IM139775]|uniref:DUF6973 domain-containing protein n=1 Tax=Xenorhabdus sp. IM139775 TaxID=3025876 RepID=UPI002358AA06|nr:hypothetical protein [Xenorhabdus sp. IM139775]MDC9593567.1 hypothetical protein [Xenorhabdus sp. IM139775]